MQKTLLFLFIGLSFTLLFTSCSKDESEEKKSENFTELIIGEWILQKTVLNGVEEIPEGNCNGYNFWANGDILIEQGVYYDPLDGVYLVTGNVLEYEYETTTTNRRRKMIIELSSNQLILEAADGSKEYLKKGIFDCTRVFNLSNRN